jgi:hypothetical protein
VNLILTSSKPSAVTIKRDKYGHHSALFCDLIKVNTGEVFKISFILLVIARYILLFC